LSTSDAVANTICSLNPLSAGQFSDLGRALNVEKEELIFVSIPYQRGSFQTLIWRLNMELKSMVSIPYQRGSFQTLETLTLIDAHFFEGLNPLSAGQFSDGYVIMS